MSQKKEDTIWDAEPHTIAKITILKTYLMAWFQIMGRSKLKQDILYIDGFAGPGKYKNYSIGSPIAALIAAQSAITKTGSFWKAGNIHCVFIEEDKARYNYLLSQLELYVNLDKIIIHKYNKEFVEGMTLFGNENPVAFKRSIPQFVFIDPFGATGVSFSKVSEILESPCSEVLINLDADGIGRIYKAKEKANHENLLNDIFG